MAARCRARRLLLRVDRKTSLRGARCGASHYASDGSFCSQLRLSYHALSRQYRLSTGLLQQSFATLDEALNVLRRIRSWLVVDRTVSFADADYEAAVRMRLDTSLLPKPFQLSALTSRELQLESPWKRFVVRSPQQLPAPVESREPTRPEGR